MKRYLLTENGNIFYENKSRSRTMEILKRCKAECSTEHYELWARW